MKEISGQLFKICKKVIFVSYFLLLRSFGQATNRVRDNGGVQGNFSGADRAYQRLRLCKSAIGVDDCILMVHSHTCKWHILVHMYVCTIMFVCTYMCNKKIETFALIYVYAL